MSSIGRALLLFCGLIWVVPGAPLVPAAARATAQGGMSPSPSLRWLRFESDAPVDEDGLRLLLPLRVGQPVEGAALSESQAILERKEIFRLVEVEFVPPPKGPGVVIHLQRKRLIDAVDVDGNEHLSGRETKRLIRLASGMIFEPELVDGATERLLQRYRRMGFASATVNVDARFRVGEIDLDFHIVEGEPLMIAGVVVEGETGLPRKELEKLLQKSIGRRRTRKERRQGEATIRRRLRRAGYYEAHVESSWQPSSGKQGVLWYSVKAGARLTLEVSGNNVFTDKHLLGLVDLEKRLIVTAGTWHDLARRMEREYRKAGYYRVAVRVQVREKPRPTVRFVVREGRRYHVRTVRFSGDVGRLARARLLAQMTTLPRRFFLWNWIPGLHRGELLDKVLNEDLARLRELYVEDGYESAEVGKAGVAVDENTGALDLTVRIKTGPRSVVSSVKTTGVEVLQGRLPALRTGQGKPFDARTIDQDRLELRRVLQRLGYTKARVEAHVERRVVDGSVAAAVRFLAVPGVQRRIGRIIVQNNLDTRERVVRRELPFSSGQALNTEALLEGQANVYRVGLFRNVSVQPLPPEDAEVRDVAVRVVERAPGRFDWGAGYNTRDGFNTFGELAYDNLGGLARQVSLHGEVTLEPKNFVPNQYVGSLGYRDPRLFDSPWKLSVSLAVERSTRSVDEFSVERVNMIAGFGRPVRRKLRVGFELQAERNNIFGVAPDAVLTSDDEGILRTMALSSYLVYEGRNDTFAPTSGIFDSLRLRYAVPVLSSVSFTKVTARHVQYIRLGDRVVFLYSLRGGWAYPIEGAGAVPIRERFFLGGRSTVRGFAENAIGPRGDNGGRTGGDLSLSGNLELRFPLVGNLDGALFTDGGGLYLQNRSVSLHDFRRSTGAGLRYLTPIGPVSLDYGIKLDRRPDESFGEIHFSIGARF